ncbi:MAG: hypothetical protein ACRD2W_23575 [Acidimicrobiales bacterium]
MPQLACPGCGAVVDLPHLNRSSEEFCPSCDFPLFWAGGSGRADEEGSLALAVRRQPGTGGRQLVATETCMVCQELNRPTAVYCRRCGAEMHPAPPPVTAVLDPEASPAARAPFTAPSAPSLAPQAPRPWWRGWILVALLFFILAAVAIASIIVLALQT